MAAWVHKHGPDAPCVLASPAIRTRQTADALGLDYSVLPEIAPGASPVTVLAALGLDVPGSAPGHRPGKAPAPGEETLLVVGHQPWIGETAALLLTGRRHPFAVRKAAVWWLVRRTRGADSEWTLRSVADADLV
jgi:phosphohistidine phosphatase